MWQYNYTNELNHHGILGMKWGVRRYQNKDGTLTPAGEKRQDKIDKKLIKKDTAKAQTMTHFFYGDIRNQTVPTVQKWINNTLNKDPRWSNKDLNDPKNLKLAKQYSEEFNKKMERELNNTLKKMGWDKTENKGLPVKLHIDRETGEAFTTVDGKDEFGKVIHASGDLEENFLFRFKLPFEKNDRGFYIFKEVNELSHHGIRGMRWGVRRYQNKDGTLTNAGRKRKKEENHSDYTEAHTKKKIKQMSSSELRERNTRLQMENQFSQLKRDQNLIIKGSSYVATTAAVLGTVVTLHANSDKLISLGKKFVGVIKKK